MRTYNCLRVPAGCYFLYCYNFTERPHEVYILKIGRDRRKLIFAIENSLFGSDLRRKCWVSCLNPAYGPINQTKKPHFWGLYSLKKA